MTEQVKILLVDEEPDILEMIQGMSQLTKQLLAYTRSGKYLPAKISAHGLVHQSINLMEHRLLEKFSVETRLSAEMDQILADGTQMQMVLLAVIENAVEAMCDGGCITIESQVDEERSQGAGEGSALEHGRHICLCVTDSGCGMTRDTADKIFDPFFATKFIGRGLGLSAAYGIVVNHGGWMEVDTRENQGTQIRIFLPLVKDQTRPSEASLPGQIAKGDATILLIEDEEMVMKAVHQLLDRMEYQVLEAGTGQMALEVLTTFTGKVDIALLDVHLPDLEAVDLYEKMRHIRPDLKVIVCSGYNKEGPVDKLLSSGATAFLQKPFSVQQLSAELKSALEADSSEASTGNAVSI